MLRRVRFIPLLLALYAVAMPPARAQLRGHGGPVRTVAVSPDGSRAVSGSFDATAIVWSLGSASAERVLRFHDSAVNAAAFLPDGRMVTAGEDASIAVWPRGGAAKPERVLKGHTAPIVALAVSSDGKTLASASWDRTVRLWSLADGTARVLEGHQQNVNGVAFAPDSTAVVSVGYDLSLRIWPLSGAAPIIVTLPAPLNAVAVAPSGEIIAGGASGKVFFLSPKGELLADVEAAGAPIIAVAVAGDGKLAAASSVRGAVAIIDMGTRSVRRLLVGPGLPAWSAAFLPDNRTLLTGGSDNLVRRWDAATGERPGETLAGTPDDPLAAYGDDPGARVFRACVACHTLKAGDPPRAGPTLAGLFGRRIATLPGYDFSPALKQLDIVWTPETVSRLFEVGPMTYTPGTKMPEQKVGAEDRAALVRFLERATKH
jgi:cytochrome c